MSSFETEMFDLVVRGAAIGALLTTMLVMQLRRHPIAQAATGLGLCVTCYLIVSASVQVLPFATHALILGATLTPLALTWFAVPQLTDHPMQQRGFLCLAALTVVFALSSLVLPSLEVVRGVLALLLYFGLILLALLTDRDDLVPERRKFRRGFLAVMACLGLGISVFEVSGLDTSLPAWVFPVQAGSILILVLVYASWVLSFAEPRKGPAHPPPAKARSHRVDKIERAMRDGIWRQEGLTIGDMANSLGIPEHQLRATINGEMGYRNFSTFINTARIDAAKSLLRDPEQDRVTILEIAHEVGFASLGPFNKAFRAQTGQSPREFRT